MLKAQRLGVLDLSIQAVMIAMRHHYLTFPTRAGLLSGLMTLQWHQVYNDSLTTDLLGNPFLFGDLDKDQ